MRYIGRDGRSAMRFVCEARREVCKKRARIMISLFGGARKHEHVFFCSPTTSGRFLIDVRAAVPHRPGPVTHAAHIIKHANSVSIRRARPYRSLIFTAMMLLAGALSLVGERLEGQDQRDGHALLGRDRRETQPLGHFQDTGCDRRTQYIRHNGGLGHRPVWADDHNESETALEARVFAQLSLS